MVVKLGIITYSRLTLLAPINLCTQSARPQSDEIILEKLKKLKKTFQLFPSPVRVENPVDNFPVNYVRPNHRLVDWVGVLLPLPDGHLTAQEVQALEDIF